LRRIPIRSEVRFRRYPWHCFSTRSIAYVDILDRGLCCGGQTKAQKNMTAGYLHGLQGEEKESLSLALAVVGEI